MGLGFFARILRGQNRIWTSPFRGGNLATVVAFAGATAAMVALDPRTTAYFRKHPSFDKCRTGPLGKRSMAAVVVAVPAATYTAGLVRADAYAQETALLAAEAIADTQLVSLALKGIAGRIFPCHIPPDGDFKKTWFKYTGPLHDPGSFPSGHALSAFAVATVYSARYRESRWVPWTAYGLASLVSLTRLPDQTHFPSDVFAGAALGYAIARFVVLKP